METRLIIAYALIALIAAACLFGGWLALTARGRRTRRRRERDRIAAEQRAVRFRTAAGPKPAPSTS